MVGKFKEYTSNNTSVSFGDVNRDVKSRGSVAWQCSVTADTEPKDPCWWGPDPARRIYRLKHKWVQTNVFHKSYLEVKSSLPRQMLPASWVHLLFSELSKDCGRFSARTAMSSVYLLSDQVFHHSIVILIVLPMLCLNTNGSVHDLQCTFTQTCFAISLFQSINSLQDSSSDTRYK